QRDELAAPDVERDVGQGGHGPTARGEDHRDIATRDVDGRHGQGDAGTGATMVIRNGRTSPPYSRIRLPRRALPLTLSLPLRGRGYRYGALSLGEGEGQGEGGRVFTHDPD